MEVFFSSAKCRRTRLSPSSMAAELLVIQLLNSSLFIQQNLNRSIVVGDSIKSMPTRTPSTMKWVDVFCLRKSNLDSNLDCSSCRSTSLARWVRRKTLLFTYSSKGSLLNFGLRVHKGVTSILLSTDFRKKSLHLAGYHPDWIILHNGVRNSKKKWKA